MRSHIAAGLLVATAFVAAPAWAAGVGAPDLKPADVEAMAKVARLVLSGQVKTITDIPPGIVTPALIQKYGEEVSISVFRDRAPLSRYSFHGKNLLDDTYGMMLRATAMPGHLFYEFDHSGDVGFFIEFVTTREPVKYADWRDRLAALSLGMEGLEIIDEREQAVEVPGKKVPEMKMRKVADVLFPSLAVIAELDSRDNFIFKLCEKMRLYPKRLPTAPTEFQTKRPVMVGDSLLWAEKNTKVNIIGTRSFLVLPGQTRAQEMFRANTRPEPPATDALVAIACAAADHVTARQTPEGKFCMGYLATTGEVSRSYDMISHGLATEAMIDLYERTKEPRYLEAARRAVEYALTLSRDADGKKGRMRFVVFGDRAELGFTALTLANLVRVSELAPTAKFGKLDGAKCVAEMAQFLIEMQYDDGSFRYAYQYDPKVAMLYESRPAHADMAAWALALAGTHGKNAAYTDQARLAATYLVTKREAAMNWNQAPAFTWLVRTLRLLYEQAPDKKFADYVFRVADTILAEQYPVKTDKGEDVVGAYAATAPQLVIATGCKMAVMAEAAMLARETKDARAEKYAGSVKLASGFLGANRWRPENSFYLTDPETAQGDFRSGIFKSLVTLDTDSYAIEALLTLEQVMKAGAK